MARRQDVLLETDKLVVVDDFAHHPTAIKETLNAIKEKYPSYKLAAFFEPRSATSARNLLFDDFVKSFDSADAVFIQEATKQNVPESERLKVHELMEQVRGRGSVQHAQSEKNIDDLIKAFKSWRVKQPAVVALIMSNGSFSGLAQKLVELG